MKRHRLSTLRQTYPIYGRKLMDLETGEVFSASPGDYWSVSAAFKLGGNKKMALVEDRPVHGKGVVGGFKRVVVKRNPTKGDL